MEIPGELDSRLKAGCRQECPPYSWYCLDSMKWAWCAVALLSRGCLLFRAARVGLAGDYIDPVGRIIAQDEASYAHTAIHMAREGGWLTPRLMGRFALYKPPMLAWGAALSARVAGISRLALRFPVALACSLAAGLIFLWVAELRSWQCGVLAAALLASNHLWHVLGSLCMMDGLLAAFFIGAMYAIFSDPWLESRAAAWGFAAAVAAAILTKSIAGVLPLAVLGLYWLAAPAKYKPRFSRVLLVSVLAGALAAPWFVYQLLAHGRWFWAEHVGVEIFGFGAGAPPQANSGTHLMFYLGRIGLIDPVLVVAWLTALPAFVAELRKRSPAAVLVACWTGVVLVSIFAWQYRNASYLLPLVPAIAVTASSYGPVAGTKPASWLLLMAAAAFGWKMMAPGAPWGISFQRGTRQPVAPIVSAYCAQNRANEFILVGIDDDLYAAALPLARLRYAIEGTPEEEGPYGMAFARMGIVITAAQFNELEKWRPVFRQRLWDWGLDSDAPIGTVILAQSGTELEEMVRSHPASDFLFPERYRGAVAADLSHVMVEAGPGHFLMLARSGARRAAAPAWSCAM